MFPEKQRAEWKTLGGRLRWLRAMLGLSLHDFGFNCGVGRSYMSKLESGKSSSPSEHLLDQIQFSYALNREWLRSGAGDPFLDRTTNELAMRGVRVTIPSPPIYGSPEADRRFYDLTRMMARFQPTLELTRMIDSLQQTIADDQVRAQVGEALGDEIKARFNNKGQSDPIKIDGGGAATLDALQSAFDAAGRVKAGRAKYKNPKSGPGK